MIITKIYCDMCGNEVKMYSNLEDIILDTKDGGHCRYEVCRDCRRRIITYIEKFRSGNIFQTEE